MCPQTIQYTAKNKLIKSQSRDLASLEKGKIVPKASDQWRGELLYIPPLPPTNLRGCHLIKIQYDVYVSTFTYFCWVTSYHTSFKQCVTLILTLVYARRKRRENDQTKITYYAGYLSNEKQRWHTLDEKRDLLSLHFTHFSIVAW